MRTSPRYSAPLPQIDRKLHVRVGLTTDLTALKPDFRFTPESRLRADIAPCPVRARNGRWRKITNHWRATTRPARIALLRRGLSLSYDRVVKQHGRSIDGETHPREFTRFQVLL